MTIYAVWNNKGGVGKSYLTFQIACEYGRQHPGRRVLVLDVCPQANASSMLLGGIIDGEIELEKFATANPLRTISGYVEDRIQSPYVNPKAGSAFAVHVKSINAHVPNNVHLVVGDEQLEIQASRVVRATNPGPVDAWRLVHGWFSDLISDITSAWNADDVTVFIDCNPSFTIYTEMAMTASDRLIIPFSADGSSKRAVKAVLALLYGVRRTPTAQQSEFYLNSQRWRMKVPSIHAYVGNRLTQGNLKAAKAFHTVVNEIGDEIHNVWKANSSLFAVHPQGASPPRSRTDFRKMFQAEINDANTASVVSGALGIPMLGLSAGPKTLVGRNVMVNQTQLNKQQPNIRDFVKTID